MSVAHVLPEAEAQATLWVQGLPEFLPWEEARPDQLPEAWIGSRPSRRAAVVSIRPNGPRIRSLKRAPAIATRCVGQVPVRALDSGLVETAASVLAEAKRRQIRALPGGTAIPVDGYGRPEERGQ